MKPIREYVPIPFFKTLGLSLLPWKYAELKEKSMRSVFGYLFSFVFLAFFISIIIMLPVIGSFVSTQMSNFEKLEVSFNTTMKKEMSIPQNDPFVTVDTRKSTGKLEEGRFLITDDYMYVKGVMGDIDKYALKEYKNLLNNEGIVVLLLLLLLPSLLFIFYLAYAIKILLIIMLAAAVAFIIARIAKFEITFGNVFRASVFSTTPMILIDIINLPLNFELFYAQYFVFVLFLVIGVIKMGDFEGTHHIHKAGKKGYLDLSKEI